jgi:hypothetical protein
VHSLERTFHRCFLPSFSWFGWGVSEEKIKMWKVNGRRTTYAKWWQKLTLPLARWAKKKAVKNYDSAAMVNQILKHNINKFNMCTSQWIFLMIILFWQHLLFILAVFLPYSNKSTYINLLNIMKYIARYWNNVKSSNI